MSKVKIAGKELDTNSITYTNMVIDEITKNVIMEAVKHFETSRPRCYDDDSRFLYHKEEVEAFWKLFKGDPKTIKCTTVYDDNGGVFCYELCRIERKYRV